MEYKSEQYKRACEIALSYGYTNLRYFQFIPTSAIDLNRPVIISHWIPYTDTANLGIMIEGVSVTYDMGSVRMFDFEPFFAEKIEGLSYSILIGYYLE